MMTSAPSYSATSSALSTSGLAATVADGGGSSSGEPPDQLSLRLVKRPSVAQSLQDSCKKRRKQSTPIRISTTEPSDEPTTDGQRAGTPPSQDSSPNTGEPNTGASFLPASSPVPLKLSLSGRSTPTHPAHTEHTVPSIAHQHDTHSPKSEPHSGAMLPVWMTDHAQGLKPTDQPDWLPLQNMAAPLYMPHISQSELQGQVRNPNQPTIRIFNPEAYCELCNKEFCNKYFLKTHKANKHRIYSDPVSEMLMNIPNFPTSAPTPPHMKKSTITLNVDVMKNNDLNKTIGSYSCDICGKGFSYKILLKNHKKSAHGIICEAESAADIELDEREPGQIEHSQIDEESIQKSNTLFKNGMPVDVSLVKEETYPEPDESPYAVTNASKMSPASISGQSRETPEQTAIRLRRMGIMNPEAFCEICCKEYCNKYFLRTHKMKRHGIIIPDDGFKDMPKHDAAAMSSWYQIQTSPLNLIMGEQNTNSSGSCGDRKASPTNENECEVCGMRFQTAYLAQLHASLNCKGKHAFDTGEVGLKAENASINNNTNNDEKFPSAINADAISEDLQKLQSMILQLNNLGENKTGGLNNFNTICNFCNKEFENRYLLQAHMIAEHNMFPDDNFEDKRDRENEIGEKLCCKICGRDGFTSIEVFKQHKIECHNMIIADTKEDSTDITINSTEGKITNVERKYPAQVSAERRSSISLTPTSSYCEICNKELCNKYFMKTHMQRMHGIEIENGAQIGGVVCNICNKELCSKYFLRVHKHNTHGIVEEGSTSNSGQPRQVTNEIENITTSNQQTEITDTALKPDLADLSHRYFSHFSEVCSICSRRFRSTKWLKAHLLGDHGKLGTEKWNELELQLQQSFGQQPRAITFNKSGSADRISSPMLKIPNGSNAANIDKEKVHSVQNVLSSLFGTDESNVKQYFCSYCSFSTPVLAFLFVHERSHSRPEEGDPGSLQCVVCNQTFRQPELLQHHVLTHHPFLPMAHPFNAGLPQPSTEQTNKAVPQSPEAEHLGGSEHEGTEPCSRCKAKKQTTDPGFSLKEVSNQSNLPASYAMPQSVIATKYVMQAFLMDEPVSATGNEEEERQEGTVGDRKFAPSIVFLPVLERLSTPLTVSFKLTPT